MEKRIEHYHQQLDEADTKGDAGGDAGNIEDPELAYELTRLKEQFKKVAFAIAYNSMPMWLSL